MRYYEGFFLVFLNHFIPIHGIVGGYEAQKHRNWVVSAASCLMQNWTTEKSRTPKRTNRMKITTICMFKRTFRSRYFFLNMIFLLGLFHNFVSIWPLSRTRDSDCWYSVEVLVSGLGFGNFKGGGFRRPDSEENTNFCLTYQI